MPCISKCHYLDKWSKQNHVCHLSHFDQRSLNTTIYILEFEIKHDASRMKQAKALSLNTIGKWKWSRTYEIDKDATYPPALDLWHWIYTTQTLWEPKLLTKSVKKNDSCHPKTNIHWSTFTYLKRIQTIREACKAKHNKWILTMLLLELEAAYMGVLTS